MKNKNPRYFSSERKKIISTCVSKIEVLVSGERRCFPSSHDTAFVPSVIFYRLKGQLCNTLSSRLALRNGAPPLTEADRKAAEERLQRLRRDADNKRLAIKNLKLALERLDITE